MKRGFYLAVVGLCVLGGAIVTTGGAQVYPVRLDELGPQPAAATPPSLVLSEGGIKFPDGSVQSTSAEAAGLLYRLGAPVRATGQTTSVATGDDGDLERGVTWPKPRFTDNGDGTVTDQLTSLIWLQDASCSLPKTWAGALAEANGLADPACGLSDGSVAGQWRLPNRVELESLLALEFYNPPVSNGEGTAKWSEGDSFTGLVTSRYWSSTTVASSAAWAWCLIFDDGRHEMASKVDSGYVWPVRGGQ